MFFFFLYFLFLFSIAFAVLVVTGCVTFLSFVNYIWYRLGGAQCVELVWFFFLLVNYVTHSFLSLNSMPPFENSSSSSISSSSVPDSPDERNVSDFIESLVVMPKHLPHTPLLLFNSEDRTYILPQRIHSSCGSPGTKHTKQKKKNDEKLIPYAQATYKTRVTEWTNGIVVYQMTKRKTL